MATEVLELQIRVSGANTANSTFLGMASGATSATRSIDAMTSSLRLMRNALVALSFARIFEGFEVGITAAQSSLNLLRTVTPNIQQASAAFDHFYQLAQQTRAPFEDIVRLAVQVSRTIADGPDKLQKTDEIVRNIAESFSVAGANGQSVRNVIRDINEMFAGGTIIMRQFRAILQQDRPLLDAVAKSVVATGPNAAAFNKILENAKQHNALSGGTLTEALKSVPGALQGGDIQRALEHDTTVTQQFAITTVTLGQALTQLNNSWIAFLQHVNDATNGLNFLAGAVQFIAQHIPLIVAFAAAVGGLLIIDVVFKAFANFGSLLLSVFNLAIAPIRLVAGAIIGLISPFLQLGAAIVTGLFQLPGLLAQGASFALRFSEAIYAAVASVVAFSVSAAVASVNVVRLFLLTAVQAAEGAAVSFEYLTEFGLTTVAQAFNYLLVTTGSLTAAFAAMGSAIFTLAAQGAAALGGVLLSALASVAETLLALAPAIAGLALTGTIFVGIGTAIYGLLQPLGQVGDAVFGLGTTWGTLPAVVFSTLTVIVDNFPLFTRALSALWDDMINSMKNKLGNLGNESAKLAIDPFNSFGSLSTRLTSVNKTDRSTDTAAPILAELTAKIKAGVPAAQAEIDRVIGPIKKQFFDLINGTGDSPTATKKGTGFDAALASLDGLISKVDPAAAGVARIAEVQKTFNKAAHEGVNVTAELAQFGLTRADVLTREIREVVGAGNADTDLKGKIFLLDQAYAAHNITLEEHTRLVRADTEAQLKTKFDAASGVALAFLEEQDRALNRNAVAAAAVNKAFGQIDAARDYQTTIESLNAALAKNPELQDAVTRGTVDAAIAFLQTKQDVQSGEAIAYLQHYKTLTDQATIATSALQGVFSESEAANKYQVGLKAISDMLAKFPQFAEQATKAVRDMQIELLNTQTDALSGFQRGMLGVQKSLDDTATTAATTVTDAFNKLGDTLSNFFETGKLNVKDFVNTIQDDLVKLAVQQTITKPLADLFQLSPDGTSGGGLLGGLFNTIFGDSENGPGGLAGAIAANGSQAAPFYVIPVGADGLAPTPSNPLGALNSNAAANDNFGKGGLLNGGGLFDNGGLLGGGGQGSFSNSILNLFGAGQSGSGIGELASAADPLTSALDNGAQTVSNGIQSAFSSSQGGGGFLSSLVSLFSGGGGAGGGGLGSLFSSLFGGSGGGLSSVFTDIGAFLGFATGGSFMVGGAGGTDSQLVQFRASPNEKVTIETPEQARRNQQSKVQPVYLQLHLHGVEDYDSFKRSKGQVATAVGQMTRRAQMRNGGG